MKLTWWGTAAFKLDVNGKTFLIDPYLSRNGRARPTQPLEKEDVREADGIFITHGHFDHIFDTPHIANASGADVYCDPVAAETLVREGMDPKRMVRVERDGREFDFESLSATAFYSRHVKFDRPLVLKTLARANVRFFSLLPLLRRFPVGQVLSWRLEIQGCVVHHFGSGGSTREELERLAAKPLDVLLVPLQGHTHICRIAADYVRILKPKLVIPHHQDDFYPPISQQVDVAPFVDMVRRDCPGTEVRTLAINESITL